MAAHPFLVALLVLGAPVTLADGFAPSLPNTPAGHTLGAWLDAFNSGDRERIESFDDGHARSWLSLDHVHAPIIVDAGSTKLWVWYYAHAGGLMDKMFDQTDPASLTAELAPNGHLKIHCELAETTARFQLIDMHNGPVISSSGDVPLIVRATPLDSAKPGAVIPVVIPAHR